MTDCCGRPPKTFWYEIIQGRPQTIGYEQSKDFARSWSLFSGFTQVRIFSQAEGEAKEAK